MLSINKIKNYDEAALNLWKKKYPNNVVISEKLDGITGIMII